MKLTNDEDVPEKLRCQCETTIWGTTTEQCIKKMTGEDLVCDSCRIHLSETAAAK